MGVDDQARDFIRFVRHQRVVEEGCQRQAGQGHLGGDALFGAGRGHACQAIAGARGRGLGHHVLQVAKQIGARADDVFELGHKGAISDRVPDNAGKYPLR
jgi:hypothetical protein